MDNNDEPIAPPIEPTKDNSDDNLKSNTGLSNEPQSSSPVIEQPTSPSVEQSPSSPNSSDTPTEQPTTSPEIPKPAPENKELKPNNSSEIQPEKPKNSKKLMVILSVAVVATAATILIFLLSGGNRTVVNNGRVNNLSEIRENGVLNFKIDGKEYKIGEKIGDLEADYEIQETFSQINADSVMMTPFSKNNNTDFLGLLYCASASPCEYRDSKLIKANFYESSGIIIDGKIGFNSSLSDIKNLYGDPTGQYYQDKTLSVWSFGDKVGDPYLAVGFDDGGLLSLGYANRIMLGVWWYEGEFKDTIKKEGEN